MEVEEIEGSDKELDETVTPKITSQRAADLQAKLKAFIEDTIENVSNETFINAYKSCYQSFEKKDDIPRPSLSGSSREAKAYKEQFNSIIRNNIEEVIDETVSSMDEKLTELENLIKTQADSTFVWRPPGDANKHMIPFDSVAKLEEKKELEDLIEKEAESINLLKTRLMQKRNKAISLHEKFLSKMNDISEFVTTKTIDSSDL